MTKEVFGFKFSVLSSRDEAVFLKTQSLWVPGGGQNSKLKTVSRGYLMLTALVFGALFVTILGSLTGFVISENRAQTVDTAKTQALAMAEAGLEYYRWHLAHFPTDLQNGTGVPGPYVINYSDPEGGVIGTITLSVTGNTQCGETTSVDIVSTGTVAGAPGSSRTVTARYARPSVGDYSYVLNADVWAGADRTILGPYHSNYGIRMDGTANSPVTSSVSSWNCTSGFGCSPAQPTAPGVVGNGPNQNLWEDSVPTIPFNNISADFGTLKALAQTQGLYYPRFSSGSATTSENYWRGYRLTFNSNGTVTVRRVDDLSSLSVTPVNSADGSPDWALIADDDAYETRNISTSCGLIFVEDHVWLEGTIPSKVTVVAAATSTSFAPNAYLLDNIQYGATDGTDGLTVIAERNVLVSPSAPNTLNVSGIFIAQDGAFGMNAYNCNSGYATKTGTLTILGTTVSSKRTGTKWTSTCSNGYNKGFQSRVDSYDRQLSSNPPPSTPVTSDDYRFVNWREE